MGKGDCSHKSNRPKDRQRKHKARLKTQAAEKRKQRMAEHGGRPVQVKAPSKTPDKPAVPLKEEPMRVAPMVPGSSSTPCPYCRVWNDTYRMSPGQVVTCYGCRKTFRLGPAVAVESSKPASKLVPTAPPFPPQKSTGLTAHRSGNSPWVNCPDCKKPIRIKGSYTAPSDSQCPHCDAEFTALPA